MSSPELDEVLYQQMLDTAHELGFPTDLLIHVSYDNDESDQRTETPDSGSSYRNGSREKQCVHHQTLQVEARNALLF